jgi:TrmH family RNA methyltransferase
MFPMKKMAFEWRIVLVRPRNPLNIGAAARAMANFGFRQMAVVEPYEPIWRETRSALGGEEVVKKALAVPTLGEAIADCHVVVGTTAGSRRRLDRRLIPLPDFPAWLESRPSGRRIALLFGSEKTGLSNEHLSFCHGLLTIPTTADCPSMNLGQAVAVCCYELARAGLAALESWEPRAHLSAPAEMESLTGIFDRAAGVLDRVGFLKPSSRAATLVKLRRVLLDMKLSRNDVRMVGAVLAQVAWGLDNLPARQERK